MPQDIIMFGLSTCVHCKKARELLEELVGQDGFTMIYMDRLSGDERNDRMRELRGYNSELSFPTIIIDGKVILGHREDSIRDLLHS